MSVWPSLSASSRRARRIIETSGSCSSVCTLFQKSLRIPGDSIGMPWVLFESKPVEHGGLNESGW